MVNRRRFLQAGAALLATYNLGNVSVLAMLDESPELPGFDILRWYAQKLAVIDPDDLEFKVLERESRNSQSLPYRVNGAYVYIRGDTSLHISRPDFGHKFTMAYSDSGSKFILDDVWLKGYLEDDRDTVTVIKASNRSEEHSFWYGHGGYRLFRFRQSGKNENQLSPSEFQINGETYFIGDNKLLEGIADYDTSRAPLLTGIYEGKHEDLLKQRNKFFRDANTEYRKKLQQIIRELEEDGKIVLPR